MAVHDHHCPWVGACIGQRNHIYFVSYVWITLILALFILVLDIIMITKNKDTFMVMDNENFKKLTIPQALCAAYGLIVAFLLIFLSGYHMSIVYSNETTQEDIREKYDTWGGNPYDQSLKQNLRYFWTR